MKQRPPRAGLSNYALRDSNQRLMAERDALRDGNERLRAALDAIAREYARDA